MTKNIIPSDKAQEKRMGNPGKNNIFVGSRQGGPMEQSRTKQESIKHQNPEYFKRQADRKNMDSPHAFNHGRNKGNENVGRGEGQIGARDIDKKDNLIPARKDVPIQRNFNHHQKNVGNDPGRGEGQVGRDQAPFQIKNFAKGTMY